MKQSLDPNKPGYFGPSFLCFLSNLKFFSVVFTVGKSPSRSHPSRCASSCSPEPRARIVYMIHCFEFQRKELNVDEGDLCRALATSVICYSDYASLGKRSAYTCNFLYLNDQENKL